MIEHIHLHYSSTKKIQPMLTNIKLFLNDRPWLKFLVTFGLIYCTLYYLFLGYVALDDDKGSFYSPFIHKYSLIQGLTDLLKHQTGFVMDLFGYETYYSIIGIHLNNGLIIFIQFPCLGLQVMIAFTALMLSFHAPHRWWYLTGGLVMVHLLNVGRMLAIFYFWIHGSRPTAELIHNGFNYFAYACILLLFYIYTRGNNKLLA